MLTNFYGQERLLKEVNLIIAEMKKGRNFSLMLQAPSGWGKTTLALKIIEETYGIKKTNFGLTSSWLVDPDMPVNFVDEVHTIVTQEVFYKYIDWGGTNLIFATNEIGGVKEPLYNRCIPLIFDPYNYEDIYEIVKDAMKRMKFELPEIILLEIADRSKLNPRVAKKLCQRLSYVFSNLGIPETSDKFDELVSGILAIDKQGLNPEDRRYLHVLKSNGGKASLTLIKNTLHLDENTIVRDIEPTLIYLGLIRITSRGRELVNKEDD